MLLLPFYSRIAIEEGEFGRMSLILQKEVCMAIESRYGSTASGLGSGSDTSLARRVTGMELEFNELRGELVLVRRENREIRYQLIITQAQLRLSEQSREKTDGVAAVVNGIMAGVAAIVFPFICPPAGIPACPLLLLLAGERITWGMGKLSEIRRLENLREELKAVPWPNGKVLSDAEADAILCGALDKKTADIPSSSSPLLEITSESDLQDMAGSRLSIGPPSPELGG